MSLLHTVVFNLLCRQELLFQRLSHHIYWVRYLFCHFELVNQCINAVDIVVAQLVSVLIRILVGLSILQSLILYFEFGFLYLFGL